MTLSMGGVTMLNTGAHVEVKKHSGTWDNPGRTYYGVIVGFSGNLMKIRVGGTATDRAISRDDIRLHPTYIARRRSAEPKKSLRTVIVVPGNATGDQFGLCLALALNHDVGILILQEATLASVQQQQITALSDAYLDGMYGINRPGRVLRPGRTFEKWAGLSPLYNEPVYRRYTEYYVLEVRGWDPQGRCKSLDIERLLRESLNPRDKRRIFTLIVDDLVSWYGKLTRSARKVRVPYLAYACINAQNEMGGLLHALTGECNTQTMEKLSRSSFSDIALGTRLVSTKRRNQIVEAARLCWSLPSVGRSPRTDVDSKSEALLNAKRNRLVPAKPRYVVVWVRFSGKRGGPHPQHDSSYQGMTQLIQIVKSTGMGVILAGDRAPSSAKANKLVKSINRVTWDLREIWKDPLWRDLLGAYLDKEHPRIVQLQFFDCLNRKLGGIIHLGMRSGNLEAFALMGHRVYYMEERDIRDKARMKAWHTPNYGSTITGPRYDRIIIEQPPTRTGKYIVNRLRLGSPLADNQIHPWRGRNCSNRQQVKQQALDDMFIKGFVDEDLDQLRVLFDRIADEKMNVNSKGISTWEWQK